MPKTFVVAVASVALLFVAAPAGAFVTFSGVANDYYSYTPGTYSNVGSGLGVAGTWDWSLVPFSNPRPAIDDGPIVAGIFEEASQLTPYGSNDPFDWNPGNLNAVAEDGQMGYGTTNQGDEWASARAFGNPYRHARTFELHDYTYAGDVFGKVPPIPEPGTLVLVGLILVGGGVFRKWR